MRYYPIAVKISHERVLVAGGGSVAERKIGKLLDCGARVTVISPLVTIPLRKLAAAGAITWIKRRVTASDIGKARLVIAATDEAKTNERISKAAAGKGIFANIVDKEKLCTFIAPALLFVSGATIAIHTDGKDPVFSRDLKNFLKEHWDAFLLYRSRL